MNLNEQNKLCEEIEELLFEKLKGKTFRGSIAITDEAGEGFSISVGNLTEKSSFQARKIAASGLTEEAEELAGYFKLPLNTRLKKSFELK